MEHSPSWEVDNPSATQEAPRLSWSPILVPETGIKSDTVSNYTYKYILPYLTLCSATVFLLCFITQPSCISVHFRFCFTFTLCHFHFTLFYFGLLLPSSYASSVSSCKHPPYIFFIAFYLSYFTLSSCFILSLYISLLILFVSFYLPSSLPATFAPYTCHPCSITVTS
jgi:hypothetical protein